MQGWARLYTTSVALGARHLLRHGYLREAVIRVVVPLDPSRYVELPDVERELAARPGERVLDLASPKLLAVALAARGVEVTSVDLSPTEIEAWRQLTAGRPGLRFELADGRSLPFADASFDHAYSVSVLEHVGGDGDAAALRELARVVRPGGRVVLTLPYAAAAWDELRDAPTYDVAAGAGREQAAPGRVLFQRWYDDARVDALLAAVPELEPAGRRVAGLRPNLNRAYTSTFPLLVPLGPLFGVLARTRVGPGGDVVRVTLRRR